MKKILSLLALLFLLQSCSVYHSGSLTVEEAVAAENKVKVITTNEHKYKFRRLEMENDQLIGITKPRSRTAKKLSGTPAETDGKFLKFDLSQVAIEEIKLRNNTLSTIINIAIPVVTVYVALVAAYAAMAPLDY